MRSRVISSLPRARLSWKTVGKVPATPWSKPPNLNAKWTSCSLSLQDGGWFPPLEELGLQQRCLVIREIHSHLMNPVGSTTERAREWRRELWAPKSASRSQTLHAKNHRDWKRSKLTAILTSLWGGLGGERGGRDCFLPTPEPKWPNPLVPHPPRSSLEGWAECGKRGHLCSPYTVASSEMGLIPFPSVETWAGGGVGIIISAKDMLSRR